jgi:acyl-CoA thioester hydrolase
VNREDFPVVYEIATRWNDNDEYGHINNATYFEYLDTAVNGWLMQQCDARSLPLGVVASVSCDFLAEVAFPDVLEIGLGLQRLGTSSITYRLGVFRQGEPDLKAAGRFVHVYVDAQTRRPVPVPGPIAGAVALLPRIEE